MKNLLKELNMTIRQFSEKYEIPYNTVRQWERGLNSPPKYVINLLREKIEREKNGEQIEINIDNKTLYIIEYKTIYAHNVSYDCFDTERAREQAIKCFFDRKELYSIIKLYECKKNNMGTIIR